MLSGGGDDKALLWDLQNPQNAVAQLADFTDSVEFLEFNFDGTMLLAAGMGNPI